METDRLRHFCAVVETGQITQAAEILGISNGGLSKSIKLLALEVGEELLLQKGRGIEVTPAGQRVYRQALGIIQQVQQLKNNEPATSPMKILKVGLPESLSLPLGRSLFEEFKDYEFIRLEQMNSGEIELAVARTEVDFGLTVVPYPTRAVSTKKLCTLQSHIYSCNKAHQELSFDELPFIVPCSELPHNLMGVTNRDGWPEQNASRKITVQASHLHLALQSVSTGATAIYLPMLYEDYFRKTFDQELQKVTDHLKATAHRRAIYLCHRSNEEESVEMKKVSALLRKLCKSHL